MQIMLAYFFPSVLKFFHCLFFKCFPIVSVLFFISVVIYLNC